MEGLRGFGASLLLIAGLLAVWQAACAAFAIPTYVLPTPLQTAAALVQTAPELAASAWATFSMSLLALCLAAALALPLALATGLSRWAERAVKPLAVTLQVTPVVAIAPLVTIWAGLDHADRAIVALAAGGGLLPAVLRGVDRPAVGRAGP